MQQSTNERMAAAYKAAANAAETVCLRDRRSTLAREDRAFMHGVEVLRKDLGPCPKRLMREIRSVVRYCGGRPDTLRQVAAELEHRHN